MVTSISTYLTAGLQAYEMHFNLPWCQNFRPPSVVYQHTNTKLAYHRLCVEFGTLFILNVGLSELNLWILLRISCSKSVSLGQDDGKHINKKIYELRFPE